MKSGIFEYIERFKEDTIVLLPGWASDYRVFTNLNLEFNYLLPTDFYPYTFENNLLSSLKERKIKKVSFFGWSLGGFAAYSFVLKHTKLVDKLILISIRKKYKKEEIELVKSSTYDTLKGLIKRNHLKKID